MNVLLIGAGGREHALALTLATSPRLGQLLIAPGNAGTAEVGRNVALAINDHQAVVDFCRVMNVGLVVIGPEAPLVGGLADSLTDVGIPVFGPSAAAARLEGSKAFTKEICAQNLIPTAGYRVFTDRVEAGAYVSATGGPVVVKYDGLMAGKGVTVARTIEAAEAALDALYANEPAAKVVIEDCLEGPEVSFFALLDGENVRFLGSAQDHKRAFDGDEGPNTGGMGAFSPSPLLTPELETRVLDEIIRPTAKAMAERGMPYRGVLYAGLMLTDEGPKLIEYNCRFGDPECQALMLRLESDLLDLLLAVAEGRLNEAEIRFSDQRALTVVMASRGYPGPIDDAAKSSELRGLKEAAALAGVTLHYAATRAEGGRILADGGRVLAVSALGADLAEARRRAYAGVAAIDWPQGFCRSDIGLSASSLNETSTGHST